MQSKATALQGAGYLLRGFRTLGKPRVLPFVLAPLLINILLFYFGLGYLYDSFNSWLGTFIANIPAWLGFLEWLLKLVFYLAAALIVAFGFTFVANLVGSPFYGLMAEQVEIIHQSQVAGEEFSLRSVLKLVPRTLARELRKLVYYLLRAIPIFVLGLISLLVTPLATLMPFIWFWFGARMLALQYVDYAYDNNQLSFATLQVDLKRSRRASLGFGAITTLASMIPLLNIITVPAAVCGGTLFYLEQSRHKREQTRSAKQIVE